MVFQLCKVTAAIGQAVHRHDEQSACSAWVAWLQEGPAKELSRQNRMSRVAQGWVPSKCGPSHLSGFHLSGFHLSVDCPDEGDLLHDV